MTLNSKKSESYNFGRFELNIAERLLLHDGVRVALTPRAFDLLTRLIKEHGHLVSKEALIEDVWADAIVEEGNLNRTISSLRKSLGEQKGERRFIETVPKLGYRFIAEVSSNDKATLPEPNPDLPSADASLSRKRLWKPLFAAGAFTLMFGLSIGSYVLFRSQPTRSDAVKREAPIRLTNNGFDEDAAIWGADDRIRFIRHTGSNQVASYVISADGTNESRPETMIKGLRTGIWSPDGKKVAFTRENESGAHVYLADADGANEIKLPFYPGSLAWSPDSSQFAYNANVPVGSGNSEILIYSLEYGKSTIIAGHPSFDANPSFSPDGEQILFNSERDGNAEIYLVNVDGTGLRRLTNHPAKEAFQVFSPDGTQIAFNSNRENEKVAIYLINLGYDTPPVRISDARFDSEIRNGCWSPDGTRIVFSSNRESENFNLYAMHVEPFPVREVHSGVTDVQYPSYSPDGRRIAFGSRNTDGSAEVQLLDVSRRTIATVAKTENTDLSISWSPDGRSISFNCKAKGNTDICVVNPDGSGLRNLTEHPSRDVGASWSPDGSEIVFASNREGSYEQFHLFRMRADGGVQTRVTALNGYEMFPFWTSKNQIAFAGDRFDDLGTALDILSLDPSKPNQDRVIARLSYHDTFPAGSPDGKWLTFVAQRDGNDEIYLVNVDGSGLLRITRNPAIDTHPRFSPDGKKLIFDSNRNGKFDIFEIDLTVLE